VIVLASLILATAVSADFPVSGIKRVIVRAANVNDAKIAKGTAGHVVIRGQAEGGAAGYHPSDPKWKETKADDWGLGFRSKQFGDTLVVSSQNEIRYIEHSYYIDDVTITVPPNVNVVLVTRRLSGEGAPDLDPPAVRSETSASSAAFATGPYQELHNLWELSPAVSIALQEVVTEPIADAGASWQATDVIGPDPQTPARRLVIAGQTKNRAIVVYEHGGFARHDHLLVFELPADAAPRLVVNADITPKARTLAEDTAAMKRPLAPAGHF
jgi:hypothetical protein